MKNVTIQISHQMTAPVNPVLDYYRERYKKIDGYYIASPDFLEIPVWIAEVCGRVKIDELVIIRNQADIEALFKRDDLAAVYGSVLDVTLTVWQSIAAGLQCPVILGGYVDKANFASFGHVAWLDSIEELGAGAPDYHLFDGIKTIPRLQLSRGCFYDCKFCTIERGVKENELDKIDGQVNAFKRLQFKYIYIDDKTFGQARNHLFLAGIYDKVKAYNPDFIGFIIQSAIPEITRYAETWIKNCHVAVIECGIETRDRYALESWNKKHAIVDTVTGLVRRLHAKFIPNVLFGIAADSRGMHAYSVTLAWLLHNRDVISWINPYILCEYNAGHDEDVNESDINKSWLTIAEQKRAKKALDIALRMC